VPTAPEKLAGLSVSGSGLTSSVRETSAARNMRVGALPKKSARPTARAATTDDGGTSTLPARRGAAKKCTVTLFHFAPPTSAGSISNGNCRSLVPALIVSAWRWSVAGGALIVKSSSDIIGTENVWSWGWRRNSHVSLASNVSPTNTGRSGRASSTFMSSVDGTSSRSRSPGCAVACLLPCTTVTDGTWMRPAFCASTRHWNTQRTSVESVRLPLMIWIERETFGDTPANVTCAPAMSSLGASGCGCSSKPSTVSVRMNGSPACGCWRWPRLNSAVGSAAAMPHRASRITMARFIYQSLSTASPADSRCCLSFWRCASMSRAR
jgi:hypothetical protein